MKAVGICSGRGKRENPSKMCRQNTAQRYQTQVLKAILTLSALEQHLSLLGITRFSAGLMQSS